MGHLYMPVWVSHSTSHFLQQAHGIHVDDSMCGNKLSLLETVHQTTGVSASISIAKLKFET